MSTSPPSSPCYVSVSPNYSPTSPSYVVSPYLVSSSPSPTTKRKRQYEQPAQDVACLLDYIQNSGNYGYEECGISKEQAISMTHDLLATTNLNILDIDSHICKVQHATTSLHNYLQSLSDPTLPTPPISLLDFTSTVQKLIQDGACLDAQYLEVFPQLVLSYRIDFMQYMLSLGVDINRNGDYRHNAYCYLFSYDKENLLTPPYSNQIDVTHFLIQNGIHIHKDCLYETTLRPFYSTKLLVFNRLLNSCLSIK